MYLRAAVVAALAPAAALVLEAPADFGARSDLHHQHLVLALASPFDLCAPVPPSYDVRGKLLLATRGDCRFATKTAFAQAANASGLVVMDNADRDRWEVRMHSAANDPTLAIPAVFVSHATGTELIAYLGGGDVVVSVNATGEVYTLTKYLEALDLNAQHIRVVNAIVDLCQALLPYMGYVYAVSFAFVLLSCAQAVSSSLYTLVLNWTAGITTYYGTSSDAGGGATAGLVRRMTWRRLRVLQFGEHSSALAMACSICLDDICADHWIKLLACPHVYHQHCIDRWFDQGGDACPLCKRLLVARGD
ncbi:hypothetical protein ACHHYP_02580 [Achlya hypogyna]|uniref:RING-type domain-containing protein n=1 Tax=Achlya hypogyna TaxID=1202772 RepID=A0A1V9Z5Y8_ACHHY|nr:hypothetical protein ACHHYP_02580 [Achlya hypogyna]